MVETHKSFCRFCHVFCGIEVDVEHGRAIAVRGDRENAVSQGYTCEKGRAEIERLYHPERLLHAQKRVDGALRAIDTDRALDEIAEKLTRIVERHGPEAVAVYVGCGGHRTSAGGPWFVHRWLEALGSPRLYTSMTIDSPSLFLAASRFFGSPVPLNLFDIDRAEVAMFVGTNPTRSHFMSMPQSNPTKRLRDAQRRGMRLIVVDPRRSDVARRADIHLQLKPGEDATLLAAMIRILIEDELYDREYVGNYASGLEALRAAVKGFDLAYAERRTGVPGEKIARATEFFARAQSGAAQSGTGLHMARHQNLSTQLVMTLNGLCGRYDRPGGVAHGDGVLNFSIPKNLGPAPIEHFTDQTARVRGIRGSFNLVGFFPEMPTNTLTDEILTPGEGQVRALIVNGGNPALVFPDERSTRRALESLDLLVVNDLFVSATARLADYVMAVTHPFERVDVPRLMDYSYPFPFSQYTQALVPAPKGVLEEWQIFWRLTQRMGLDLGLAGLKMESEPTADELLDVLHAHSRIPLDEVRQYPGGHIWGEPRLSAGDVIPNMIGHEDHRMALGHPEVLEELRVVRAEPTIEGGGYEEGEAFDFRMITWRMPEVYCTQGHNLPSLQRKRRTNPALVNPRSLEELGLCDGDIAIVDSGFGQIRAVVAASEDVAPGVVALAHGWGDPGDERAVAEKGCNVQRLIPDDERYDPLTGLALQSAVPVNLRADTRSS